MRGSIYGAAFAVRFLALLALAAPAAGQERPGAVYVSGLLNVPWSQGLTEDSSQIYVLPPGGFSLGWSAAAGVFVATRASIEFEVSRTGILERTEFGRYDITYYEERRDTFFTASIRLHSRPRALLDIEPVLGFDVVREESWRASDHASYTGGPVTHSPRVRTVLPTVSGFSAGADARLGAGRIAFVASFRLHRTFWGNDSYYAEASREWTLRPGAGVRVTF